MLDQIRSEFRNIYNNEAKRLFFAPGRVNLIGEHIDYNGGNVFPCAIDLGTYLAVRKREDSKVIGFSENFSDIGIIKLDLDDTAYDRKRGWMNYVVGVFDTFLELGYELGQGLEIYVKGDIPNGAGLSSSASIEVATAFAVNEIYDLKLSNIELAKLCQRSENEYNGVKCGIMDQFAVAMGKKDHAILLDCNSLKYEYIPMNLEDKSIVIINSNKKRTLADSKYNERRASCDRALAIFKEYKSIDYLCELTEAEFYNLLHKIEDVEIIKRARHAITENQRVFSAVEALKDNNISLFSKLMRESHLSLKNDYEVSVYELDKLVELSWSYNGTWGARMTGAGFGGCTINIVQNSVIEDFISYVSNEYFHSTGLMADFYVTRVSEGVHEIK